MNLLKRVLRKLSYGQRRIYDPITSVPEFQERITWPVQRLWGANAAVNQATADNLLFAVQYVNDCSVEGDIAEFGCMTGRTATVISGALASFKSKKKLHLFDSFEGLPKTSGGVDSGSIHVQRGDWAPGTCKGISPTALKKKCRRYLGGDQLFIYEGWFSETMPTIPPSTVFAMLHVDCDLYQSTMDVLDYLFSHKMVARGAIILFDDWNCNWASNEQGERKAWRELVAKYAIDAEDSGAYACFGHKFIIHTYVGR